MKEDNFLKSFGKSVGKGFAELGDTIKYGDWKTRLSMVVMGAGNLFRGQIVKGAIFFIFEFIVAWYMFFIGSADFQISDTFKLMIRPGKYWLSMLPSLGTKGPTTEWTYIEFLEMDVETTTYHDDSFQILLFGVLTIFLIIAFVIVWRMNLKAAYEAQKISESGKKVPKFRDDVRALTNEKFYKTLLFLPIIGITVFTVMPIVFMILVAFTNYDGMHNGYTNNLFTWVGWENFKTMLSINGGSSYASVFGNMLVWTLVWAFFATFTNYFLGILVAMMINKKGIKLKKMWRTILVLTIAIPQFISLLYVSRMFNQSGIVNATLMKLGWIKDAIPFWTDKKLARIMVVLINIWVGVPYQMLISTGILMNIPEEQYESARIDGASPAQQFFYVTLPYMLFITGPYLLTSFTGNMNNFNVIFLLTGGGPTNSAATSASGSVGYTDLLITWLFKITQGANSEYYMASVVGIMVFIVVAIITVIGYNRLSSNKNEGDMS